MEIFTIGHSNRTLEFFVGLLLGYEIQCLVDIRTFPYSRFPHFNGDVLAAMLEAVEVNYVWRKDLGGRRHPKRDSRHTGWTNSGFRGYADYMETAEFEAAIARLIDQAKSERVAIMCSEAVPWRCHRSLVADALIVRGVEVFDIMSRTTASRHLLTPWAQVQETRITYLK
jgi:uncharacterized protein (DUF488 family)